MVKICLTHSRFLKLHYLRAGHHGVKLLWMILKSKATPIRIKLYYSLSLVGLFSNHVDAATCGSPGDILQWSVSNWTYATNYPSLVTLQGPILFCLITWLAIAAYYPAILANFEIQYCISHISTLQWFFCYMHNLSLQNSPLGQAYKLCVWSSGIYHASLDTHKA